MKRAKVIHDNLNAGGGSEHLAFTTIELLNEMGFVVVDLATLQKPNLNANLYITFFYENTLILQKSIIFSAIFPVLLYT